MYIPEKQKEIGQIFLDLEIIAFEFFALNTRSYWEGILVVGSEFVKK